MRIYITAEFESVDMADLASGRVRDIPGVSNIEVLRNRFAAQAEDENVTATPFIASGAGWSYTNGMGAGPFYTIPFSLDFGAGNDEYFEPARRRDALLKVEVNSENTAKRVSSLLRSIGGRGITIVRR